MTFNGAIMQLVEMRENSMMPVAFKPYFDKVIETLSEVEPAPQWIHYTPETVPDSTRTVNIRFDSGDIVTAYYDGDTWRLVEPFKEHDGALLDDWIDSWCELPEPYQPESERSE